jgi:hypothetical protein
MSRGGGIARGLASGINGYIRGVMIKRNMDREDKRDAWDEEQRGNLRADRARTDAERQALIDAGQPVQAEVANDVQKDDDGNYMPAVPAYRAGGQRYDSMAEASGAASAANAPDAVAQRQSAALRGIGKPLEAAQLEAATTSVKAGKFQLEKGQEEWLDQKWDKAIGSVGSVADGAEILTTLLGRKVTTAMSEDGKKVQFMAEGPNGQMVKMGTEFSSDAKGLQQFIMAHSKTMTAAQKIGGIQAIESFEESKRQFLENKRLQEKQIDNQASFQNASLGIARGNQAISQGHLDLAKTKRQDDLEADPLRKLPGPVKAALTGYDSALKGIDAAMSKAQAEGQWDPQSPGAKELIARQRDYQHKREQLLKPHLKDAGGGAYPFGDTAGAEPKTTAGKAARAAEGIPGSITLNPQGTAFSASTAPTATTAGVKAPPTAPGAVAPAQPAQDPLLVALGADNSSAGQIVAQKAPALRQAADGVRAAQAQVVQAAQSRDPQAVAQASQQVQAAAAQVRALIGDLNPPQAQAVMKALGL